LSKSDLERFREVSHIHTETEYGRTVLVCGAFSQAHYEIIPFTDGVEIDKLSDLCDEDMESILPFVKQVIKSCQT
jgi:hypothetical protein